MEYRREGSARTGQHGLWAAACTLVAVFSFCVPSVQAQEMEVPVAVQVPLFLKVMTFDRQRSQNGDVELVVGVTFQSGYRKSITTRDEVQRALGESAVFRVRTVLIDLDRDDLNTVLVQQRVNVLYVAPLRAVSVEAVAALAASAHVTSFSGVPAYVEQGIAIGVRLVGDRPRLMINLLASRRSGADFASELLRLAEVFP